MDLTHLHAWDQNTAGLHGDPLGVHNDLLAPSPSGYPHNSCGVVAEGTAINHLVNANTPVDDYATMMQSAGTYDPTQGMPVNMIGELSQGVGLTANGTTGQNLEDIQHQLDAGAVPIVAVDSSEMFAAGQDHSFLDMLSDTFGINTGCDHATLVTGTKEQDGNIDSVVVSDLNTSVGNPPVNGPIAVDAAQFQDAMADCNGAVTYISDPAVTPPAPKEEPGFFESLFAPFSSNSSNDAPSASDYSPSHEPEHHSFFDSIGSVFSGSSESSSSSSSDTSSFFFSGSDSGGSSSSFGDASSHSDSGHSGSGHSDSSSGGSSDSGSHGGGDSSSD